MFVYEWLKRFKKEKKKWGLGLRNEERCDKLYNGEDKRCDDLDWVACGKAMAFGALHIQ